MPRRSYKAMEECRSEIKEYSDELDLGTDDSNVDKRVEKSTDRYKQDLRWFDHWLDGDDNYFLSDVSDDEDGEDEEVSDDEDEGVSDDEDEDDGPWIESVRDLSSSQANKLGRFLANEFNGTTPRYRWDQIHGLYEWMVAMEYVDVNPLEKWQGKRQTWGLTKTTQQETELEDGEGYAVTESDIRAMEENVGRNRIRDQLCIRTLWQTGIRRQECSRIELDMIDRDAREIELPGRITKNGKPRTVAYQESLDPLLNEWLDYGLRNEMVGGREHDYLFVGEQGARLRPERINEIVAEAADRAGINRKTYADASAPRDEDGNLIPNRWLITAHNIRHGFGTYLVNETDAGIWEVSKQMGHSSVSITEDTYVEDDPTAGIDHVHQYGPD